MIQHLHGKKFQHLFDCVPILAKISSEKSKPKQQTAYVGKRWPDLAKYCHFGNMSKDFGDF